MGIFGGGLMKKIILVFTLVIAGCAQDVQFGKVPVVSVASQTPPNTTTPPSNPNPPSTGLLACPAPDGISVCDPWIFIGWDDINNYATGYMRRRNCDPAYDCRTLDHNGPCTLLNPLDEPGGPLIAVEGPSSCDRIVH